MGCPFRFQRRNRGPSFASFFASSSSVRHFRRVLVVVDTECGELDASVSDSRTCDFCRIDLLIGRSSASRSSGSPSEVERAARILVRTR